MRTAGRNGSWMSASPVLRIAWNGIRSRRLYDSVAIRQITEDGEIDRVDAGKNQGDSDNWTHPVSSALTEGENESPSREHESADEGCVQASLGTAPSNMLSIEPLLIHIRAETDQGGDAVEEGEI